MIDKVSRERRIPAGTPIFVENMVAESMFIIKSGIVRLSVNSASGQDHLMDKLSAGDAFGELSLLIGGHRMVSAAAETECELIEIPRRDFIKLQKQKPQTCLKLMISIINHFGKKVVECRDYLKPLLLSQLGD